MFPRRRKITVKIQDVIINAIAIVIAGIATLAMSVFAITLMIIPWLVYASLGLGLIWVIIKLLQAITGLLI